VRSLEGERYQRKEARMATTRRNQVALSPADWQKFIAALGALRGMGNPKPRYGSFVDVHVRAMQMGGMSWGVHTMPNMNMVGRNFLAWHRRFILRFEQQLQKVDPTVALPYWDPIANPNIPDPLNTPAFVSNWGLVRDWDPSFLPVATELTAVKNRTTFGPFQAALERLHGGVHLAVGGVNPGSSGQMAGSNSPADPLFWLHHANIDRIWAEWQTAHPGQNPANPNEVLKPSPIIAGKVSGYFSISSLGYAYA
jgi:tyrosinase